MDLLKGRLEQLQEARKNNSRSGSRSSSVVMEVSEIFYDIFSYRRMNVLFTLETMTIRAILHANRKSITLLIINMK